MTTSTIRWIKPQFVILHCSATPDFKPTEQSFDKFGLSDIDLWHRQRGFDSCGYHVVIRRSGKIEFGRKIDGIGKLVEKGAHCRNYNSVSVGVCYVGTKIPTDEQKSALVEIYSQFRDIFGFDEKEWYPHHKFSPKKICPGIKIEDIHKLFV